MSKYSITATVVDKSATSGGPPPELVLFGLGVEKRSEILNTESPQGMDLTGLRTKLNGISKNANGGPMPLSLLWSVPTKKKGYFNGLGGRELKMFVFVSSETMREPVKLTFDVVKVRKPVNYEQVELPDKKLSTYYLERVNFHFKTFIDDPDR